MPETLDLLDEPALEPVRAWGRVLSARRRNDPEAVRLVQRALAAVGLPLTADGRYGPGTAGAVRSFQAWAGLGEDGVFGSRSLYALAEAVEQKARVEPRAEPPSGARPRGIYNADRFPGVVALTFDDGPHPSTTPRVLDILRDRAVVATFFVLGTRVRSSPELVRRMVAEGHRLGNHTMTHPQLGKLSAAAIERELDDVQALVDEALGRVASDPYPMHVRPPYGDPFFSRSAERREKVGAVFARRGAANILWQIDSRDWAHPGDPAAIVLETRSGLRRAGGGVVLMHDVHKQTVDALPGVLDAIAERGWPVVSVDRLLELKEAVA